MWKEILNGEIIYVMDIKAHYGKDFTVNVCEKLMILNALDMLNQSVMVLIIFLN